MKGILMDALRNLRYDMTRCLLVGKALRKFLQVMAVVTAFSAQGQETKYCEFSIRSLEIPEPVLPKWREKFGKILHKDKKARRLGPEDPHFPVKIVLKPHVVAVPPGTGQFLSGVHNGMLDLNALGPNELAQLSREDLGALLSYLGKQPIRIKWYGRDGRLRTGKRGGMRWQPWDRSNAAIALALKVAAHHERDLLAKMITLEPFAILDNLKEGVLILDEYVTAKALLALNDQLDDHNTKFIATASAELVQRYVRYWAGTDAKKLNIYLVQLVLDTKNCLKARPGISREKQIGLLIGGILAGTVRHAHEIKSTDERRLWLVNSISNIVWAMTTFVGVLPIAIVPAAASAGAVSLAAVMAAAVYAQSGMPRDYAPSLKEIEGEIEVAALQAAAKKGCQKCKVDILTTLAWVQATAHLNGITD